MDVRDELQPTWGPGGAGSDLTARARIGNAALRQFAQVGFAGTSMRMVADAAGVSVGLVQHHFGTKAGLREACDAYVRDFVRVNTEAAVAGRLADADFLSEAYRTSPPVMTYLVRALIDDSPGASALFDYLVEVTERYTSAVPLPGAAGDGGQTVAARSVAAVLTAMKLGITMLHPHISRVLQGPDGTTTEAGWHEISKALLAIVSPAITEAGLTDLAGKGITDYERTEEDNGD